MKNIVLLTEKVVYIGLPLWAQIVLPIVLFILLIILGLFFTGLAYRKKFERQPLITEEMLRALGKEIGRPFSEQQITRLVREMKKQK